MKYIIEKNLYPKNAAIMIQINPAKNPENKYDKYIDNKNTAIAITISIK